MRRPLTIAAPPVVGHRLQMRRLSSCGPWAQLLRGMWDPPRPGLEPVSPALAGRLSTTAPPGKPGDVPFLIPPRWCSRLVLPGPCHRPNPEPHPPRGDLCGSGYAHSQARGPLGLTPKGETTAKPPGDCGPRTSCCAFQTWPSAKSPFGKLLGERARAISPSPLRFPLLQPPRARSTRAPHLPRAAASKDVGDSWWPLWEHLPENTASAFSALLSISG